MIQILYESSLVIIDKGIANLRTHENNQSYMTHITFIYLITCRQIAQTIYMRGKEYQWHPLDEKGYSWNQPFHGTSKITNLATLERTKFDY